MGSPSAVIEPAYFDSDKKKWTYLMVTPDGRRVEFRQNKASADYITSDSSYAKLSTKGSMNPNDPPEENNLTVTTSDGTAMVFDWTLGGYRCARVTDRNGNYILYTYDAIGRLMTMIDTLGRVVNMNYHQNGTLTSITQTWNGGGTTHTWASFEYTTKAVSTGYDPASAYGPQNGTSVTVLDKINYPEGSYTKFEYNGYLQVTEVKNYADNDDLLNKTAPSYAVTTADAPKMEVTAITTSNFNGSGNSTVTVSNSAPAASTFAGPYGSESTSYVDVTVSPHPNSLFSRIHYAPSSWKEGLTIATEDCVGDCGNGRKRWTWNGWTQDSTSVGYILNPRVYETRVGDSAGTKTTEIGYTGYEAPDPYHLPTSTTVKGSSGAVIASSSTSYVTDSAYISRRILRLPSFVTTSGLNTDLGNEAATSTNYFYDGEGFTGPGQIVSAFHHDSGSHGASFVVGRGNVTKVQRNAIGGGSTDTEISYNITGSPIKQLDPRDRPTTISYADNFTAGSPPSATHAYPTSITDPGGFVSTMQYRYDVGANSSASSPNGFTTARTFDSVGRLLQQTITGGAYTRYQYSDNGRQFKTFSTITDGAGEAESESWTDGAGRTYRSRSEHPNSIGGWSAVTTTYDAIGRIIQQSVPTEVNSAWNLPSNGDDTSWKYTSKTYDWKGRVKEITNTDGTNQLMSYEGCGCTGGQITTIEGELIGSARRKQKITEDALGRPITTETFQWDGLTPFTTVINKYNGRGQVVRTEQHAGGATAVSQDVTMQYDGYGRMTSRHYPIENAGTNTVWTYNEDDSVQTITDPRGSITSYLYGLPGLPEKRAVATNISYTASSGVPASPTVSFVYDNVGNRTSMTTAGVAIQSYSYNTRSQLESETLNVADSGIPDYTIGYTYHIGGGLKSVTDPFNKTVNYTNDKVGRLTGLSGTPFGDNTIGNFADTIRYRAFGEVKSLVYKSNDNATVTMEYDNRLRVSRHKVASGLYSGGYMKDASFSYYADSRPSSVDNHIDPAFDRTFNYDYAGRLTHSEFGIYTNQQNQDLNPHLQDIVYDGFSNIINRETEQWGANSYFGRAYEATTGRIVGNPGWGTITYDESGNLKYTGISANQFQQTTYDAAGRQTTYVERWQTAGSYTPIVSQTTTNQIMEGDGKMIKHVTQTDRISAPASSGPVIATYFVSSSVLGRVLTEVEYYDGSELKRKTNIVAGRAVLAEQRRFNNTDYMAYLHADPVTGSKRTVDQAGVDVVGLRFEHEEYEPLGQSVRRTPPFQEDPPPNPPPVLNDAKGPEWQCTMYSKMGVSDPKQLPANCSSAYWQSSIWERSPISWKEGGNPSKINPTDSPIPGTGMDSPNSKALAFAMGIAKKRGHSDDGKDESKIPTWENETDPVTVYAEYGKDPIEANNAEYGMPFDESLASCISDLLKGRFSDVNVHGTNRNAVSGVWFSPGTSLPVKAYDWVSSSETWAITVGLTVHYDTAKLPSLSKPTWGQFQVMVEEIAHVNQFLNMWAAMPRGGAGGPMVGAGARSPTEVAPNYASAVTQWGLNYAAAVLNTPTGKDSYAENAIEKPAKNEAFAITSDIRRQSRDSYGPCGR